MQNIICSDDACAKEAISLLKKSQSGRLTFLPVESIRVKKNIVPESLQTRKGYIGLASELVDCPQNCKSIVDYLLGRVILCDNLDNAVSLAKNSDGPFRFVTTEGEIINAAGAITGGSLKNNTGNLLSRKAEIKELSNQLSELKDKLNHIEKDKAAIESSIIAKQAELKEKEEMLRSLEMEQAVRSSEIRQLEILVNDIAQSDRKRAAELDDLKQEVLYADESVCHLQEAVDVLQVKIEELNQYTAELYGEQK